MPQVSMAIEEVPLPLQLIAKVDNNAVGVQLDVQPLLISVDLQARLVCCEQGQEPKITVGAWKKSQLIRARKYSMSFLLCTNYLKQIHIVLKSCKASFSQTGLVAMHSTQSIQFMAVGLRKFLPRPTIPFSGSDFTGA